MIVDAVSGQLTEDLVGFALDLLFFSATDLGYDVADDVEGRHTRVARARDRLHGRDQG